MKLIRAIRPVVWTCQMTLKDMDLTSDNEGSSLVIGTGVTLMNDCANTVTTLRLD
jgi:hypothetical protein